MKNNLFNEILAQIHFDGDTVKLPNGMTATVRTPYDEDMGPPWKEHDGHGVVTEWTSRDKRPSERVLSTDGQMKRYYDFAASVRLAIKDGWGLGDDETEALAKRLGRNPTEREVTVESVERDFRNLKDWCDDKWHWIGIVVEIFDDGVSLGKDSLWGVESSGDYWKTEAAAMIETLYAKVENNYYPVL